MSRTLKLWKRTTSLKRTTTFATGAESLGPSHSVLNKYVFQLIKWGPSKCHCKEVTVFNWKVFTRIGQNRAKHRARPLGGRSLKENSHFIVCMKGTAKICSCSYHIFVFAEYPNYPTPLVCCLGRVPNSRYGRGRGAVGETKSFQVCCEKIIMSSFWGNFGEKISKKNGWMTKASNFIKQLTENM